MSHGYIRHIEPGCIIEDDPGEWRPARPVTDADRDRIREQQIERLLHPPRGPLYYRPRP